MQKQFRLKKRAAFAYVYRKGEKTAARDLLLLSAKSKEGLKIGLSVSKKVGNAVTRNHVKRLIREALKPIMDRIDDGYMCYRGISTHCRERFFLGVEVGRASVFTCGETQMIKRFCLFLLLLYKRTLSPITGNHCAYTPTCSMYSYDAISKYGAFVGILLTIERLLRCTPFAKGGFDPVKENYRGKIKWLI